MTIEPNTLLKVFNRKSPMLVLERTNELYKCLGTNGKVVHLERVCRLDGSVSHWLQYPARRFATPRQVKVEVVS